MDSYSVHIERESPEPALQNDGSISLTFSLSSDPPAEWISLFDGAKGRTTAYLPPKVRGAFIDGSVRDERMIGDFIADVDARIAKANTDYEQEIAPKLRAAEERRQAEQNEQERRLQAAKDEIRKYEERG